MPVTHDMGMHLNQMKGFHQGLTAGRLYPRWQENTNNGFGAPTTIFYPPAIYYATSILFSLTGDWLRVIKALYLLMMALSGLALFGLARRFFSNGASLSAMAVYMIAPYHVLNHYQRGALAECLTFIWMPLTLLFIVDLIRHRHEERDRVFAKVAGLALMWGLFIWSHPPTAYQFLLIGGPVLTVICLINGRKMELAYVTGGLILGLALSSAYLLPAIAEQRHIHAGDVEETWPYHESYILNVNSVRYDHQADDFVVRLDRLWLLTILGIVILTVLLVVVGRLRARSGDKPDRLFWIWAIAALYASFMMLRVSKPIGELIPRIEIGVFAWRMMAITNLSLAMLTGSLAEGLVRPDRAGAHRGRGLAVGFGLAAVSLVSLTYVILPMYRAEAFDFTREHSNYSLSPLAAARSMPLLSEVILEPGAGTFSVEKWEPEHRVVRIGLNRASRPGFRTFNFPGWTAASNGVQIPISTGTLGEVTLDLPAGTHEVVLEFSQTRVRSVSALLSLVALVAISVFWWIGRGRRRV